MKTAFIYFLKDPENPMKGYVGKTNYPRTRLSEHLRDARKKSPTRKRGWITSLKNQGLKPALEVVDEVPFEHWQQLEVAYIEFFLEQGYELTNSTPGGEGGQPSEETKRKMSLSRLGNLNSLGRKLSEETKRKMSLARLGKKYRKHSEEDNAKQSAALRNQKSTRNRSGFVGVCWHSGVNKWIANFRKEFKGKRNHVGYFSKIEDAVFARALSLDKYF